MINTQDGDEFHSNSFLFNKKNDNSFFPYMVFNTYWLYELHGGRPIKGMDFLTFREHLSSPPVFEGVAYLFSHIMCLYVLSSVMWCPLLLLHRNDIRFVFTSSCLWEGSCLINVVCACLRIVVSNLTQHILCLFLFCFSSSCFAWYCSIILV